MDSRNHWHPQQEEDVDELAAYAYQQEEQPRMFAPSLTEQQQYYTSPPAMAPPPPPPSPFYPSQSSSFPNFGGPAALPGPSTFGGLAPFKNEPGQPSSSSSILSFGGQQPPRTLSFSAAGDLLPDGIEAVRHQQRSERRSRAYLNPQEHVIAERRRREKMQQQFVALATIIPDLPKTDKVSILGSTIKHVKQLEERARALKEQTAMRTSEPTVFESKCRITSDNDAAWTDRSASLSGAISGYVPTVEASTHGDTVLLKICCNMRKGVVVMVYSEVENHGLSIINSGVVPFTDSCLSITITAKIGEGFSTTTELINNLTEALRHFA